MKVLVTVASKHGATEEIGRAIAETLQSAGMTVDLIAPERVESVADYDAVVVGSAVFFGRWMASARDFVTAHATELRSRPVWLFGSGPITPTDGEGDVADANELSELIGARGIRLFAGRLRREGLNLVERVSVAMVHSPWGDYRSWDEIRRWAQSIAESLVPVATG
jgi:menaquinone-dependent protoporphyrinogen oxidase